MNKTTIKISVLAFLGFMTYGYAQQQQQDPYSGKVGINTVTPSATMDVQPNSDNARVEAKTNEGIIAPKLSKTRIANIETPVEGTLVYATDETTSPISAYTGGDTKVAKITEKGYYYYNGTEWVKAGSDATDQLWAQRDNGGVIETYLKPAAVNQNNFYYSNNGLHLNFGNVNTASESLFEDGEYIGFDEKSIPNSLAISSSRFPNNSSGGKPGHRDLFYFNQKLSTINNNHPSLGEAAGKKAYVGDESRLISRNSLGNIWSMIAHISSVGNYTANKLDYLGGSTIYTAAGLEDGSVSPLVEINEGLRVYPRNYPNATSKVMKGIYTEPRVFGGTVNSIYGIESNVSSVLQTNSNWVAKTLYEMMGSKSQVIVRPNTTVDRVFVNYAYFRANKDSNVSNEAIGVGASGVFSEGATVKSYAGVSTYTHADGAANVENFYGFRFWHNLNTGFSPTNMYGVYLADVNKGTASNYSIYTNAGNIRFGDLKHTNNNNTASTGDRPVFVTADGVLKVGNASTALARAVWVPDTASNSVQLAITSANGDRTTHPISITDEGMVRATSFQGVNGATIFPDYVFQKYYTGTSSIKADYNFKSLSQVEDFVKANGHLPGYKSAATIKAQGYVDLMETQLTNVEKIEELYLHLMEKEKEVKELRNKNQELENRLERLEKLLK
ncbi:hypothetical protein [Bergeyella zoohelcum]|uniref:Uncharacterized protein n=1 Tax=Bergeyella zoohelcum TaxID=1015 RepID=A0A7Z8YME9_9FLAO|nr:hypothetical protein [Bergeyella zoohelcum]VDH03352.1 Uncharacterised protein [Bergeyella zoohelcum]